MKYGFLQIVFVGLLLGSLFFVPYSSINALEVELTGGINHMTFHPDRVFISHNDSPRHYQFQSFPFGTGDLIVRGDFSGNMGFNIHASRNNILWNTLYTKLTAEMDHFSVEFGPFIGITDNFERPIIGIAGDIQFAFPGIVFLGLGGSYALGSGLDFTSNNTRETGKITLGFWLGNVIPSVSVEMKSFTRHVQREDSALPHFPNPAIVRDEQMRFQASAEFFGKTSPLILRVDGAYQVISRTYNSVGPDVVDTLNAFLIGAEVRWQVTQPLRIIAGFEIPLRYTTEERMTEPDSMFNLFRAHAGIVYTFFPRTSGR